MSIKYLKRIFIHSCIGIVLSVIIRETFDGVAFLFCISAIVSYMAYSYLNVAEYSTTAIRKDSYDDECS